MWTWLSVGAMVALLDVGIVCGIGWRLSKLDHQADRQDRLQRDVVSGRRIRLPRHNKTHFEANRGTHDRQPIRTDAASHYRPAELRKG